MKIYKAGGSALISSGVNWFQLNSVDWDTFLNREDLKNRIEEELKSQIPLNVNPVEHMASFDPPMGNHEIWAAGVTYQRSKEEREKESKESGGAQFYDKVYDAARPELFFKATAARTVGSGDDIHIRKDSVWNVPEPELALFITSKGSIEGYTIGNDMSSRSIEGENPLYLPQAKTYEKCAGLGPCLYLPQTPISLDSTIHLDITRDGNSIFEGQTTLSNMKRTFDEIIHYLFLECDFPIGCFLMTGTGIVPPENITLEIGDKIQITIEGIGELMNIVNVKD